MSEGRPALRPLSSGARVAAWAWAALVAATWTAARFRLFHGWPW